MNTELGYCLDVDERFLLIPILKCGSRSVRKAAKPLRTDLTYTEAVAFNYLPTIAVVRHPWDRLVSALFSNLMDARPFAERLEAHILGKHPLEMNSHIRPQWFWIRELRIDYLVRVDHFNEDWQEVRAAFPRLAPLRHIHRGEARPEVWQGLYDWAKLLPQYQGDFNLCPDWSA